MRRIYYATVLWPHPRWRRTAAAAGTGQSDHRSFRGARQLLQRARCRPTVGHRSQLRRRRARRSRWKMTSGSRPTCIRARVEFMFRMRERHRLRVDMWELNRSSALPVRPPTIVFGDITLTPADIVVSQFNWRQSDFTYTYSVLKPPRFELGVGLGLHLIQAEAQARVYAAAACTRPSRAPGPSAPWRSTGPSSSPTAFRSTRARST